MTFLWPERRVAARSNEVNVSGALHIAASRNAIRRAIHALLGSGIVSTRIDSPVAVALDFSFEQLRQRWCAKQLSKVCAQRPGLRRLPAQTCMPGRVRAEAAEVGHSHA